MKIVTKSITIRELKEMSSKMFDSLVKAVVDVKKEIMAVDAELHADEEQLLLKNGSRQTDLWGINIYPDEKDEKFIEFDSMINIRPYQSNRTRRIDDPKIREKVIQIVNKLVKK
jgi:hypothetical protein